MAAYPLPPVQPGDTAPVPRRVRGVLGGVTVFDTVAAVYVWEWPFYPQYYVPLADVDRTLLVDEHELDTSPGGTARRHGLSIGNLSRPGAALVHPTEATSETAGLVRFRWDALDAWFEEDEQVFVHPRNPYTRVDALRSTRHVRIELDGVLLAESFSPVMVFETGLPTRYYLNPSEVVMTYLVPSETVTSCPYKGMTSHYWSVDTGAFTYSDLAWSYDFPTAALLPVAGLIAFLDEKVDVTVDGRASARPITHFA